MIVVLGFTQMQGGAVGLLVGMALTAACSSTDERRESAIGPFSCEGTELRLSVGEVLKGRASGLRTESVELSALLQDGSSHQIEMDSGDVPRHMLITDIRGTLRGEASERTRPLNVFFPAETISDSEFEQIVDCLEARIAEIRTALNKSTFGELDLDDRPIGQLRAYWRSTSDRLEPVFYKDDRQVWFSRDGEVRLKEPSPFGASGSLDDSLIGKIITSGQTVRIECCMFDVIDESELSGFADRDGRSIEAFFGTSISDPG